MRNVAAVMILVSSLTSCGTATRPHLAAALDDPSAVEQEATFVFSQLSGTAAQREAAHYLEFKHLNAKFEDCMNARGWKLADEFSPIWTGYTPNATSGSWMGVMGIKPSRTALAVAESSRAEDETPTPGSQEASPEYRADARACSPDQQSVDLGNLPGVPEGSPELTAAFKKLIFDVDDELGPIDSYDACMLRAGIDYRSESDGSVGWQGLYKFLLSNMPEAPLPSEGPTKAWSSYLELESSALASDTSCRLDQYQKGLLLLGTKLEAFEREHSVDLKRIAGEWQQTSTRAIENGLKLT